MTVLCYTRAQMDPIVTELRAAGLPCTIVDLGRILYVLEVIDIRALLTAASDPKRGDRVIRLLAGFGIDARDLRALASLARELTCPATESDKEAPGTHGDHTEADSPLLNEALDTLLRWYEDGMQEEQEESAAARDLTEAGRAVTLRTARATQRIREVISLPLPNLTALAEQVLGLGIEIATRVGHTTRHRALDTFHETARAFTVGIGTPTLTGFLEWLDAAEEHESAMNAPGVEPSPGAVQLLAIRAAKGLKRDVVVIPGMGEQVFPSYTSAIKDDLHITEIDWMGSTSTFPFPLRADAGDLSFFAMGDLDPAVTDKPLLTEVMSTYRETLGHQSLCKGRRLAYVVFTQACYEPLPTSSHLSKTASRPHRPSRFLIELQRRDLLSPYAGGWVDFDGSHPNLLTALTQVSTWPPNADAVEPMDNQTPEAEIEGTVVTDRLVDVRRARYAAATQVTAAMNGAAPIQEMPAQAQPDDEMMRRWRLEAGLLLAERTQALSDGPAVRLPEHLAVTRLDDLRADRHRFALDLRRPLPPEPRTADRLGTVFHDAVVQHLSTHGTLFGLEQAGVPDSLGSQDRDCIERWLGTAKNLPLLENYVLAKTETDREITVGATTLRCRIDAVFQRLDGSGWLIVDWKTGRRQVPVDQLSVYVHAWAVSQGVSTGAIRAAYVYADYPEGHANELSAEGLLSIR